MLLNEIEKYDTAKEIYEYLLNIDSADKCLVKKVIPAVEKVVKFEKLYGNSKTDAIQTVKQYYVTQ